MIFDRDKKAVYRPVFEIVKSVHLTFYLYQKPISTKTKAKYTDL